jgi:putative spermidine/putrescine transport system ATP-binding protein
MTRLTSRAGDRAGQSERNEELSMSHPVLRDAGKAVHESAATDRLQLVGVTKRYKSTTAVRDVDLTVAEGEFVTFLGQSGSGKTTTLKLIAGFETCDAGSIKLAGQDVSSKPPRDRDIGMVFQNYALFPHLSVQANVAYGLKRRGWPSARVASRAAEMLELIDLSSHAGKLPHQLSGGQQQRVALARALAPEPKLLLMDEPLGALDRALRLDLESEIRRIHQRTAATVIYVTHDRDEALAMSDRIAVFHAGEIVGVDRPERLYDSPPTAYVARLLTDANVAPLPSGHTWQDGRVEFELGGRSCRLRGTGASPSSAQLAIPRRAISLGDSSGQQAVNLRGRVTDVVFLGELIRVDLSLEGLGPVVAHVPNQAGSRIVPGSDTSASIDLDMCRVVA